MCRLVCVRSAREFAIGPHLGALAQIARHSSEYQGHGWGCAWREGAGWRLYHNIRPIWEDDTDQFGRTTMLLAHARSAFRDEGVRVENNMPFFDGRTVFIFNGELRGVRLREQGRIGAEKVFNVIRRFDDGQLAQAVARGTALIARRSRYVRAMNLILARDDEAVVATRFNENPDYFQMHRHVGGDTVTVASRPYPGEPGWEPIDNGAVTTVRLP